jgi:Na+-transporting methylmalonyl-CoA/oxaloacetate decarboxylase gamma subunit
MGVVIAVIIVVVIVCFFVSIFIRRHGESDRPNPDWRRTDEVFNDPSTNRVMRVWLDQLGERHYVPEGK